VANWSSSTISGGITATLSGSTTVDTSILTAPGVAFVEFDTGVLPSNLKQIIIRVRNIKGATLRIAYVTGEVASSSGDFITVCRGEVYARQFLSFTGKTIFIGSSVPNITVEVEKFS